MTSIGEQAFYNCSSLTSVTVEWQTPPSIAETVFSNRKNAILFIPKGTLSAYQSTDYWKEFGRFIEVEMELPSETKVSSLTLSSSETKIPIGSNLTLTATVLPTDATNQKLTWTSSNMAVATVTADGVVSAIAEGTTIITAQTTDGSNLKATCTVTVTDPDTDITTIDNVVYIPKTIVANGERRTLSIRMKNSVAVQGFGFDLYLPSSVSVARDNDGELMVNLSTERTNTRKTNYFASTLLDNGALRVLASSTNGSTISGSDGEIVQVTVLIDDNLEEGDYPIILREITLTDNNSNGYDTDYVRSTLSIWRYTRGDVNNDGKINVTDFTAIANHILSKTPQGFIVQAADVNHDEKVNVTDLTAVANIILKKSVSVPMRIYAGELE